MKDQDSYVGFVGVQEEKQRQERNPSPNPPASLPPSFSGKPAKPALPVSPHVPKPDVPAPAPHVRIRSRTSSLGFKADDQEFKKVQTPAGRPPKPSQAPPSLQSGSNKGLLKPSKSLEGDLKAKKNGSPSKVRIGGGLGSVPCLHCQNLIHIDRYLFLVLDIYANI